MGNGIKGVKPPRWDLSPVYPSFDSGKYKEAKEKLGESIGALKNLAADGKPRETDPAGWLTEWLTLYNTASDLFGDLYSYAYAVFSTDTNDPQAMKEINALESAGLPLKSAKVLFRNALAELKDPLSLARGHEYLEKHRHFLEEQLYFQQKQMSPAEENLANDLSRSGGDAWGRLQETVSANLKAVWDDSTGEEKTVVELRELAYDKSREVRKKAFQKELELWKGMETPLAFALNGVKGFSVILNSRRRFKDSLERSTRQARISEKALEALISVMEDSLPVFREYLKAKAGALGLNRCAFFDLFAPVGSNSREWPFDDAKQFIIEQFDRFSPDLSAFAETAFRQNWIDGEMRPGKVGGAYCIDFPLTRSTRVFCNFSNSFGALTTLAHELGHGYHHHILKDESYIHRDYPMTLAETASIFAENIVIDGALSSAQQKEKLAIVEISLQDSTQVIVDILSRFYFEKEVFLRRVDEELSPDEFSAIMVDAQKRTYGNGLDENHLHPYMWAVKGHYYSQDLAFYNFPYAFGLLFGLGLFSIYKKEGKPFGIQYQEILKKTGMMSANQLIREIGFDIEQPDFWKNGIAQIEEKVALFKELAKTGD